MMIDSGADVSVIGLGAFRALDAYKEITPVKIKLLAAGKQPLTVLGTVDLHVRIKNKEHQSLKEFRFLIDPVDNGLRDKDTGRFVSFIQAGY